MRLAKDTRTKMRATLQAIEAGKWRHDGAPHLFDRRSDVRTVQRGLFDGNSVELEPRCADCGRRLIITTSGWACYPAGKLRPIGSAIT